MLLSVLRVNTTSKLVGTKISDEKPQIVLIRGGTTAASTIKVGPTN
jgi:hypothetical protein